MSSGKDNDAMTLLPSRESDAGITVAEPWPDYSKVKFLKTHRLAQLPEKKTMSAAGMDLCTIERFTIAPGEIKAVDVGFKMELPPGWEAQVRPRSGLALKHGITVLNSPGTIDADYRGPVKVILINHGKESKTFICPNRIAQMVLAPVLSGFTCEWVKELSDTKRGDGGFGSTGA